MAYGDTFPSPYGQSSEQPSTLPNLVLPESSTKPLTMKDLDNVPAEAVGYGRNEIYAKHGRPFSNPNYANYFAQQPWYQVNPNFQESDLSPLEKRNALFLHVTELTYDLDGQRAPFSPTSNVPPDLSGSLIPDSSARQLNPEEITNLSGQQLRLAQNEIYARHGYPFQSAAARNYFSQFSWYQANPNYSDRDLSWLEERNIEMMRLQEIDRQNGWQ